MYKLKTLILDDDQENINVLELYLKKYYSSIETVYSALNKEDATALYLEHKPNILLLDIELENGTNSFSMLKNISTDSAEVIFISSHKDYAIQALNDYEAIAYISKPYRPEDLVTALDKAVKNLNKKYFYNNLRPFKNSGQNLIAISQVDSIELIDASDIVYLQADSRYTTLFLKNNRAIVSSRNLGEYAHQLDPNIFFRIHHKYIVNIKMVKKINKTTGNYCEFENYKPLPIAKRRLQTLIKFLKLK